MSLATFRFIFEYLFDIYQSLSWRSIEEAKVKRNDRVGNITRAIKTNLNRINHSRIISK